MCVLVVGALCARMRVKVDVFEEEVRILKRKLHFKS